MMLQNRFTGLYSCRISVLVHYRSQTESHFLYNPAALHPFFMRESNERKETTSERWVRIEEVYHRALECQESERSAFVREVCAGDDSLRSEVEALLAGDREARSFLEQPALQGDADTVTTNSGAILKNPRANFRVNLCATRSGTRLHNPFFITGASLVMKQVTSGWPNVSRSSTKAMARAPTVSFIWRRVLTSSNRFSRI